MTRYIHGFGSIGHDYRGLPFHQYWIKLRLQGRARDIGEYSLNTAAAPHGKFMSGATDVPKGSPLSQVAYAYHFDAGLYAQYLRRYAEARGVRRIEGEVVDVSLRGDGWLHRSGDAEVRRAHRRRSVHRLLRIPRPAHRAGAEDRLRRLDPLAALRSRRRRAQREGRSAPRRTRARPRAARAGSGASRCSIAPATATCIRVPTSATPRPRPRSRPISTAARWPNRAC